MARTGKRLRKAYEIVNKNTTYPFDEALKMVKDNAQAKFDETIDIAVRLNIDARKADQNVRGMVQLPSGTGKTVRVAVFVADSI